MYAVFNQNNSGGDYYIDLEDGININVAIEIKEDDKSKIFNKAQEIGLYFDGVRDGKDCECCGDRWHEYYDLTDSVDDMSGVSIHFLNGEIKNI